MISRVDRLGKRTLDGNVLTLENRTNFTRIVLTKRQARRWRIYLTTGKLPPRRTPV